MELKATLALTPGMEIAEDVLDHRGNVIIKKNSVLDKFMIQKLTINAINCVCIKEPEDYMTTYFEKIKVSKTFVSFSELYSKNFATYQKMMEDFLDRNIPINNDALLNIISTITTPFIKSKITILDMLSVNETSEKAFLYAHALNVALICSYTGKWFRLDDEDIDTLILCGFYYDIGKFAIPAEILHKQGKLTDEEFNIMKSHTLKGYQFLQKKDNIDEQIKLCALMHHERIDGSGYPQKLTDKAISKFAKIIAILDSYEAMTSYRSYREPLCPFSVVEIFEKTGYGKYDTGYYMTFLERIVEEYIGKEVQLSDSSTASIVLINKQKLSRPMVKVNDKYVDLSQEKSLKITNLI